jgi:DNA-binding transcriptional LysR family regulator
MVPNGRQLEAFVRVYRECSITAAARAMHLTQPAVSVLIRRLESSAGIPLFHRAKGRLTPTAAADTIIAGAERALDELHDLDLQLQAFRKHSRSRTLIAVTPSLGTVVMPSVLAAFESRFPGTRVFVRDVKPVEAAELVGAREVEFGLGTVPSQPGLAIAPVAAYSLLALVRRDAPVARRRRVDWRDIAKLRIISISEGHFIRAWIDEMFSRAGVSFNPAVEVSQFTSAIAMVQRDLGCAIVPSYLGHDYEAQGLVALRVDDAANSRELMMMKLPGSRLSAAARCLLELIGDEVRVRDAATRGDLGARAGSETR